MSNNIVSSEDKLCEEIDKRAQKIISAKTPSPIPTSPPQKKDGCVS